MATITIPIPPFQNPLLSTSATSATIGSQWTPQSLVEPFYIFDKSTSKHVEIEEYIRQKVLEAVKKIVLENAHNLKLDI